MRATALLKLDHSEEIVSLGPGEFIGRSDMAALCVDDPRISEAHAMVSLRGHALKLLALRGRFRVRGRVVAEATLREGMRVELAQDLGMRCERIHLPTHLLGLRIEGMPPFQLMGTMTLYADTTPRLAQGFDPEGDAIFWAVGEQWRASITRAAPRVLKAGETLDISGLPVQILSIPIDDAEQPRTRTSLRVPLTLRCLGEAVRVETPGTSPLMLTGIPGKILAALIRHDNMTTWRHICDDVWAGDASTETALRRRFDTGLGRLRARLDELLPDDERLIVLDGAGMVTLQLTTEDRVERVHG